MNLPSPAASVRSAPPANQNRNLIFSSDSGSGKVELNDLVISHIVLLRHGISAPLAHAEIMSETAAGKYKITVAVLCNRIPYVFQSELCAAVIADKGCLFAAKDEMSSYPAVDFPSVDATGASDIFISCLAAQLSKGNGMDTAIKLATIAASYSVSKEGVQNAIISPDLLEDLYKGDYSLSVTPKE